MWIFLSAVTGDLSLKYEWQQVSSGLQDSSILVTHYYWSLDGLYSFMISSFPRLFRIVIIISIIIIILRVSFSYQL